MLSPRNALAVFAAIAALAASALDPPSAFAQRATFRVAGVPEASG